MHYLNKDKDTNMTHVEYILCEWERSHVNLDNLTFIDFIKMYIVLDM